MFIKKEIISVSGSTRVRTLTITLIEALQLRIMINKISACIENCVETPETLSAIKCLESLELFICGKPEDIYNERDLIEKINFLVDECESKK